MYSRRSECGQKIACSIDPLLGKFREFSVYTHENRVAEAPISELPRRRRFCFRKFSLKIRIAFTSSRSIAVVDSDSTASGTRSLFDGTNFDERCSIGLRVLIFFYSRLQSVCFVSKICASSSPRSASIIGSLCSSCNESKPLTADAV